MLEKRFIVKTAGKACDENTVYYLNYRITVLTDRFMEDWRPMAKPAGKAELGFGVCSKKGVAVIDDSASLTLGDDG